MRDLDGQNIHRFVVGLLLLLAFPQDVAGRADSAEWVAAKRLAQHTACRLEKDL